MCFYYTWDGKKHNEIRLTKNKMHLNNRKMTNHSPSRNRGYPSTGFICLHLLNKSRNYSDFIYCAAHYSITDWDEVLLLNQNCALLWLVHSPYIEKKSMYEAFIIA